MNGGLRRLGLYLLAGAGVFSLLAGSGSAARAQSVQQLEANMRAMQAEMRALQKQVQEAKAAAAEAKTASSDGGGGLPDLKVKWKGAPELSSSDGKFKFKVRGRIMTDFDSIDQDKRITGRDDINGVELRRARLGVEGVLFYDWKYKFEADFAADEVALKDVYVAYANWLGGAELSEIRAGNYYVYASMEEVTSSRFITFLERASFTEAFLPSGTADRQTGGGILLGDQHWSFQTGYYGAGVEEQGSFFNDTNTFSVRGTLAPINNDTTVVHLGGSFRHRESGDLREDGAPELFRYRARGADLHLADRFVQTPGTDFGGFARSDDMFVLEGAFVWRSLSVQGEYAQLKADLAPSIADVNPTYNGWYVDASWFITGEMRNYESTTGEFGRIKVKNPVYAGGHRGGWGAWQIAGRYDVLDLSDKAAAITAFGAVDCEECREQKTWLLGLNWWTTDYTAIKLQVSQSKIDGGVNDGAKITGVGVRAQVDW
jgi:phosphate-selective porin OprO/OprP